MPKFLKELLTLLPILIIFFTCNKQRGIFELEVAKKYGEISSIESYASCQGPNGAYRTSVKSQSDASFEFRQEFTYRDAPFHAIVTSNNEGFIIDSLGNRADTLSKEVVEILRSHAFHKIHIHPEYLFSNIQYHREEDDLWLFNSMDQLGNSVVITYDPENKWIEKFIMRNPMDTAEQIEIRYSYVEETPFGPLAKELLIIQGGKDEFTFNFDSVFINEQKITF